MGVIVKKLVAAAVTCLTAMLGYSQSEYKSCLIHPETDGALSTVLLQSSPPLPSTISDFDAKMLMAFFTPCKFVVGTDTIRPGIAHFTMSIYRAGKVFGRHTMHSPYVDRTSTEMMDGLAIGDSLAFSAFVLIVNVGDSSHQYPVHNSGLSFRITSIRPERKMDSIIAATLSKSAAFRKLAKKFSGCQLDRFSVRTHPDCPKGATCVGLEYYYSSDSPPFYEFCFLRYAGDKVVVYDSKKRQNYSFEAWERRIERELTSD